MLLWRVVLADTQANDDNPDLPAWFAGVTVAADTADEAMTHAASMFPTALWLYAKEATL
jgi:hypothetical protein